MLKITNVIIVIFLIATSFSVVSLKIENNNEKNEFLIYQITPDGIITYETMYRISNNISISLPKIYTESFEDYNYIILTINELESSILSSNFISWKESLGYKIKIIEIMDELIQDQEGKDLQEKIRNFLREYYTIWNIKYMLIVGDHETIPMRYCYPNPNNHRFEIFDFTSGEVPTDYYYSDLSYSDSESWDSDGDGYYGEYNEDNPDFYPEIFVGRIPTNDDVKITYTLDKIVKFESDSSSWKNNALNVGAFFYFSNETSTGLSMDGAVLSY